MRNMRHVPQKYSTGSIMNYLYKGEVCIGTLLMFDSNDCTYLVSLHGGNSRWIGQEDITCYLESVMDVMVAL